MKKAIIKITVVFSFAAALCILISCSSRVGVIQAEDIVSSFKAKMIVTQNDSVIECSVCRNNEESAQITIDKPDQIKGLKFKWSGNDNGIIFGDFQLKTETAFLPDSSFAQAIMNVLKVSSKPENLTSEANLERKNEFSGMCDSGKFKLIVNDQGLIETIYIEDMKLEANFTEVEKM